MGHLGCSGAGSLKKEALDSEEELVLATLTRAPFPSPTHLLSGSQMQNLELCIGCKPVSSETSDPAELCCSPKEGLEVAGWFVKVTVPEC